MLNDKERQQKIWLIHINIHSKTRNSHNYHCAFFLQLVTWSSLLFVTTFFHYPFHVPIAPAITSAACGSLPRGVTQAFIPKETEACAGLSQSSTDVNHRWYSTEICPETPGFLLIPHCLVPTHFPLGVISHPSQSSDTLLIQGHCGAQSGQLSVSTSSQWNPCGARWCRLGEHSSLDQQKLRSVSEIKILLVHFW